VERSVKYRVIEIANGGQAAQSAFHSSVIVVLYPPSSNLDPPPTFAVSLHFAHRPRRAALAANLQLAFRVSNTIRFATL
jgi:hypothetical protein